ncbi:ABC transporter ATP-binding protein [Desulfosporosinus fructosivorans]
MDIVLTNLNKGFGDVLAVNNITLCLEKGQILTLLGPSGCGKTTLLRLIAGFESPTSGTIQIAGKCVAGEGAWVAPEKRQVGMVFQDYALFPHLTVAKNLAFGLQKRSAEERRRRIEEVIQITGLHGLEKRYPHELSGGQQQRVALARTLAPKPVVILLDEPFSNLDAALRTQMRKEIPRILRESGSTAIFVTHDQKDALTISDKIVILNQGVVQQIGTPREVYQYPENEFVASFIGETNVLKGTFEKGGIETAFGLIPCPPTHDLLLGAPVSVSVRPESIKVDPTGPFRGVIREVAYSGSVSDAEVAIGDIVLHLHLHPEVAVERGNKINFRILPDFVTVIKK